MTTWNKLCRVCSSPAEYQIFSKIPNYLHSTSNEFINWQRPINILLQEVTGFKVTEDDGLPQNICALCISYLKHAVTFREQCIKNMLSLKVIQEVMHLKKSGIQLRESDKDSLLISEQQLEPAHERKMDPNILLNNMNGGQQFKVNKAMLSTKFDMPVTPPSQQYIEEQMRYINLLFDKDMNAGLSYNNDFRRNNNNRRRKNNTESASETFYSNQAQFTTEGEEDYETETSSDENQNQQRKENIFSYREKNFEEDDIMQDLQKFGNSITINLPESCKERKCRACFRRFMFEETFKDHMENCTEYNFLQFTEEINRLWDIRRSKAVSPHEYIRRTIFSLRKICDWLKVHCNDIMVPDLNIANGDAGDSNRQSGSADVDIIVPRTDENPNKDFFINDSKILKRISSSEDDEDRTLDETVIENLCISNITNTTDSFFTAPRAEYSQSPEKNMATPITIQNNILYEIERVEQQRNSSRNDLCEPLMNSSSTTTTSSSLLSNVQVRKPIPVHANVANLLAPSLIDKTYCSSQALATPVDAFSTPPRNAIDSLQSTPSISVRKDLLKSPLTPTPASLRTTAAAAAATSSMDGMWALSDLEERLQQQASSTTPQSPLISLNQQLSTTTTATITTKAISARCNSCNVPFETISQFEVHNAVHHNLSREQQQQQPLTDMTNNNNNNNQAEDQRRRIIAMFEDENNM